MKVLMIGGTGIISTDITRLAATMPEVDLYLLNRGNLPEFVPDGVKCIQADINDAALVRERIAGMHFDVVADFISYDVPALDRKLDLFLGHCGQFIFISSCAAYNATDETRVVTEANTPTGNPHWTYGLNKTRCEDRLKEACEGTDTAWTVVRPAYTYNDIRILHPYTINHWRSWTVAQRVLDGKPYVIPDDGQVLCTAMHATDFARAFAGLWGNPAAMNEDFHITSSEYLTWRRVAEYMAEALGVGIEFCHAPIDVLCDEVEPPAAEKARATTKHSVYDNEKVRRAVPGFSCRMRFADGIRRTIQFYLDNPEYQRIDEKWDAAFERIAKRCGN